MGVPVEAAAGPRILSSVHQVDEQGTRCVQAGGQQGGLAAVGPAQKQAGHELRDDGTCFAVLLPARHPRQGRRPATGVPVRGRAQGHRRDRLHGSVRPSS